MAEHTLILLRHGKSDWSGDEADIDRPLAKRGRRQAPEAGHWLATHVDRIDLAVVSTAKRARESWDLVSAELGERPDATRRGRIRGLRGRSSTSSAVSASIGTVVLVGHNPDSRASRDPHRRPDRLPTSALVVIELDGPWRTPVVHLGGCARPAAHPRIEQVAHSQ